MENLLYESMTKLNWEIHRISGHHRLETYTIRCWRQEDEDVDLGEAPYITDMECRQVLKQITFTDENRIKTIAKALIEIPRMNAIEVIDKYGIGVVIYKNWP